MIGQGMQVNCIIIAMIIMVIDRILVSFIYNNFIRANLDALVML